MKGPKENLVIRTATSEDLKCNLETIGSLSARVNKNSLVAMKSSVVYKPKLEQTNE
jgi:hypothetical protein